eukprot:scaffold71398_cov35-Prasinocladus_malaysianus.AAC.4
MSMTFQYHVECHEAVALFCLKPCRCSAAINFNPGSYSCTMGSDLWLHCGCGNTIQCGLYAADWAWQFITAFSLRADGHQQASQKCPGTVCGLS